MKKVLFILSALCIMANLSNTVKAEDSPEYPIMQINVMQENEQPLCHKDIRREYFDLKLNLSEEQKEKALIIRSNNVKAIKPLIKSMDDKMLEARAVKLSRISIRMQEQKLAKIDKEIIQIRKNMMAVCVDGAKDFEAILTKDQKKALKKMRNDFQKCPMAIGCF